MISIFGVGKCKINIFGLWRSTRACKDKKPVCLYFFLEFKMASTFKIVKIVTKMLVFLKVRSIVLFPHVGSCQTSMLVFRCFRLYKLKMHFPVFKFLIIHNTVFISVQDHDKLRQGLQRVVATKGAWVITGGTNAGIMKICGEAVRDHVLSSVSASDTRSHHFLF